MKYFLNPFAFVFAFYLFAGCNPSSNQVNDVDETDAKTASDAKSKKKKNSTGPNIPPSEVLSPTPVTCVHDGMTYMVGATTPGYSQASVPFGQQCDSQGRKIQSTCTRNGNSNARFVPSLNSHPYRQCSVQNADSCQYGPTQIPHGTQVKLYNNRFNCNLFRSVKCQNGTLVSLNQEDLDGFQYISQCAANESGCSHANVNINHAASKTFFREAEPSPGESCDSIQLTCTNGTLSRTGGTDLDSERPNSAYAQLRCDAAPGLSCMYGSNVIPHNSEAVGMKPSANGRDCDTLLMKCKNGTWKKYDTNNPRILHTVGNDDWYSINSLRRCNAQISTVINNSEDQSVVIRSYNEILSDKNLFTPPQRKLVSVFGHFTYFINNDQRIFKTKSQTSNLIDGVVLAANPAHFWNQIAAGSEFYCLLNTVGQAFCYSEKNSTFIIPDDLHKFRFQNIRATANQLCGTRENGETLCSLGRSMVPAP